MNRFLLVFLVALLGQSCATRTPSTDLLVKEHLGLPRSAKIKTVPFIHQEINHCGPASVAMVLKAIGRDGDLKELTKQMFTPGSKGTFSTDLTTAVRRQGLLAISIHDLKSMLTEISAGNPVVVFQNLGFTWMPFWHYAVALGYDLDGPDLILHSGKKKFQKSDLRIFERSWSQAGYWGLVILNPGSLAASVDDLGHVDAISILEQSGRLAEAQKSYEAVLTKWPQSLPALIGMGNVLYGKKDYTGSSKHLLRATEFHPQSAIAWHNLATAQGAAGKRKEAKASSFKALSLVDPAEAPVYQESLKEFLNPN